MTCRNWAKLFVGMRQEVWMRQGPLEWYYALEPLPLACNFKPSGHREAVKAIECERRLSYLFGGNKLVTSKELLRKLLLCDIWRGVITLYAVVEKGISPS